ncbi:peroxidase-like [Neodiprion fabricii]|uniref:peroxidase-like n=1 Tax=Neodiprion fabricii TaxID=2872261 RepID=UPI001ED961CD|nr:peroxidase-like [Neodiprion fabricii]XP_046420334.1 peroxidase-like [Neodiprion fabricii]
MGSRKRLAGVFAIIFIAQASATVDDFLNLTPSGNSVPRRTESRKSRYVSYAGDNVPLLFPISSHNIFFGQTPVIYQPYGAATGEVVGNSQPNQSSQQSQATCGDRFNGVCEKSRYRTFDGSCNNPYNPTWGQANTRYARLLPSNYADGIHEPTRSVSGNSLPLSREVSLVLFPDVKVEDKMWTLANMQWGQIVTHDMAMIDGSTQSKAHPTRCCTDDGQFLTSALNSPLCYPIVVPPNDPVHAPSGTKCLNFVRSTTDLDRGCSSLNEPAEQLTTVTGWLDLSIVYGSDDQTAASLRAGIGGRLNVDVRNGREWPPAALNKSAICDVESDAEICYRTGDARANQNPQLTVMQIMLLREHNRIADVLAHLNPHWTDEIVFQEARRIAIAQHQYITYYEWLPIFLGVENSLCHKIIYDTNGYVDDYSPSINPSILNEHSNAAFRYFHSLIAGRLQLVNEHRFAFTYNSLRLSDHFNQPGVIEQGDNMNDLIRGLGTQPEEASDQYFTSEVTQFLFRAGKTFGSDLRATDIQRGRDHGLASYNQVRQYCGLPKARRWADFTDYISPENVKKLAQLYETPDDVDLTVGGSLESHVNGALAGPTFVCILLEQFYRTRAGDRFWFESSDQDVAFTPEQLTEIRKSSISKLFCDNGDNIKLMQPRGFEIVSEQNPLIKCNDLPGIDLSLWRAVDPRYRERHYRPHVFRQ